MQVKTTTKKVYAYMQFKMIKHDKYVNPKKVFHPMINIYTNNQQNFHKNLNINMCAKNKHLCLFFV